MIRYLWALVALCVLWLPGPAHAQMSGFVSPGPLARPHAELEGLTNCAQCHALGKGVSPEKCMACHERVREQVATGRGFHADKGQRCASCHPDHLGRDHPLVQITSSTFNHDATGFPLRGAHTRARCEDCHEGGDYRGADPTCSSCHDSPHGGGRFAKESCDTCHQTLTWDALPLATAIFDHTDKKQTRYILEHAHVHVSCRACHAEMRFSPVPHERCADCHANPHHTEFGVPCESCHATPESWLVERFDHNRTRFPLQGLHRSVTCESCHGSSMIDPIPRTCVGCHTDPHRGQFADRSCDACHSVEQAGFRIPEFDHEATGFSLEGRHQDVACETCHGAGRAATYAGIGRNCDACHEDAHDGRYEPVPCARCHRPIGFEEPHFDHATTRFPHTGAHVGLACDTCHTEGEWTGVTHETCNDCHSASNPHDPAPNTSQCADCHVTTAFTDLAFDHLRVTGFDLAPAHSYTSCRSCHQDITRFVGPDPACEACHTPAPSHYKGDCATCHQAPHWVPGDLGGQDHAITGFALHGAHKALPCASCHEEGEPRGAASGDCASCHGGEDPHMHLLGNQCGDCHTPSSWYRTRFRHATTGWPLRGSHRLAECVDCHAAGYVGTPTQCWRCHESEASLLIPAHQSAYLPLCDTCHRPYTWAAPGFPH